MENGWLIALPAIMAAGSAALSNCLNQYRFRQEYYQLSSKKLSKPLKIVFLTDLHEKVYGTDNEPLLRAIRRATPNLVLVGGDMMVARHGKRHYADWDTPALNLMTALAAEFPVIHSNGNHETCMMLPQFMDLYHGYMDALRSAGVTLLFNSTASFSDIVIYGFVPLEPDTEPGRAAFEAGRTLLPEKDSLSARLGPKTEDRFCLLLAHNPDYFEAYADWGADLVLAGHQHGGLIRLFRHGFFGPSRKFFLKRSGGRYTHNGSTMIVSRGLGSHTLPVRIFNPPELTVLELRPE